MYQYTDATKTPVATDMYIAHMYYLFALLVRGELTAREVEQLEDRYLPRSGCPPRRRLLVKRAGKHLPYFPVHLPSMDTLCNHIAEWYKKHIRLNTIYDLPQICKYPRQILPYECEPPEPRRVVVHRKRAGK